MTRHTVVSRQEWLDARLAFLAKEKVLTRQRDELAWERQQLPWVRVEKEYLFDSPEGILGASRELLRCTDVAPAQVSDVHCGILSDVHRDKRRDAVRRASAPAAGDGLRCLGASAARAICSHANSHEV